MKWRYWMNYFHHWIEFSLSLPIHVYLRKSDIRARSFDRFKIIEQLSIFFAVWSTYDRTWCPKRFFFREFLDFKVFFDPNISSNVQITPKIILKPYIYTKLGPKNTSSPINLSFFTCVLLLLRAFGKWKSILRRNWQSDDFFFFCCTIDIFVHHFLIDYEFVFGFIACSFTFDYYFMFSIDYEFV